MGLLGLLLTILGETLFTGIGFWILVIAFMIEPFGTLNGVEDGWYWDLLFGDKILLMLLTGEFIGLFCINPPTLMGVEGLNLAPIWLIFEETDGAIGILGLDLKTWCVVDSLAGGSNTVCCGIAALKGVVKWLWTNILELLGITLWTGIGVVIILLTGWLMDIKEVLLL